MPHSFLFYCCCDGLMANIFNYENDYNIGEVVRLVWVVKRFRQSRTSVPILVEVKRFQTEEEAMRFFEAHKRTSAWPWEYWTYPEEAVQ